MDESKKKITIFYDGQCNMCTSLIDTITTSKKSTHFLAKDMHSSVLPKTVTLEDINKEIYVTDSHGTIYKNADAVLKILEEYCNIRYLTTIGRLPILRTILSFGYNVVAANRHLMTGPNSTIFWMKIVLVFAFISSLLISSKLWLTDRLYPLTPIHTFIPIIGNPFDYLLYGLLIILLLQIARIPKPQKSIWASVLLIFLLLAQDQSRLQPWVVQYLFILITLGIFYWKKNDNITRDSTLVVLKIIIVGTYAYSGLQKINLGFMLEIMPWLLQPVTSVMPSMLQLVPFLAIAAPFVQIFFAIGLLTQKFRRISLILAVLMHIFILAMIGPFGNNWNSVVWPWTIAMALFDILLFKNANKFNLRELFSKNYFVLKTVTIFCFIVLPIFSFFNYFDSYLSSALYSGNTTQGIIYTDKNSMKSLPVRVQAYATTTTNPTVYSLDIINWSMNELHVPAYPETRIYKNVTRRVCLWVNNASGTYVRIEERRLFNSTPLSIYTCSQL